MHHSFKIVHTKMSDLAVIFELFDHSIRYQENKRYPTWRNYDRHTIVRDMEGKHQYKIAINARIAMVFSVSYSDKIIWRERDNGESIYLHRIVVNPAFKGQKLFGKILAWAVEVAAQNKLRSIRMDTWADNPVIIDYYKTFGFAFVETYATPDTHELPVHNRKLTLALLEYECGANNNVETAPVATR